MSGFNSTLSRSLVPSAIGIAGREMDDLFERLFQPANNGKSNPWIYPASIWEEGEHYYLEIDLPGVSSEDVDLTFEEGRLRIAAKRMRQDDETRKYVHDERYWGESSRTFAVPDSVDPESIEAEYHEGVLQVRFAKRPEVLPRKIEITVK